MLLLKLRGFEALKAELERFNMRLKCPKFARCLAFKSMGGSKTSEVFQLKLAGKLQGEWLAHLVFPICIQQTLHSGIGWGGLCTFVACKGGSKCGLAPSFMRPLRSYTQYPNLKL